MLCDAETIVANAGDRYVGETVRGQLRAADLLLLNKIDLVGDAGERASREWLEQHAPHTPVLSTTDADVDAMLLFAPNPERPVRAGDAIAGQHSHHAAFDSWSFTTTRALKKESVKAMAEAMPAGVLRAKGIVALEGHQERHVFQKAGARWTLVPDGPWAGESHTSIIAIGLPGAIDDTWLAGFLEAHR